MCSVSVPQVVVCSCVSGAGPCSGVAGSGREDAACHEGWFHAGALLKDCGAGSVNGGFVIGGQRGHLGEMAGQAEVSLVSQFTRPIGEAVCATCERSQFARQFRFGCGLEVSGVAIIPAAERFVWLSKRSSPVEDWETLSRAGRF